MFLTAIFNIQSLVTRKQEAISTRRVISGQNVSSSSIYYCGKIWIFKRVLCCDIVITPFPVVGPV